MRPSVRVFRYLAVLTPLLGLALAGCGGLLGSVDGRGTGGGTGGGGGGGGTTPTQFSVAGRAFVEKAVTTRAFTTGDSVVPNGTVTILEVTSGGSVVGSVPTVVTRATGTTDANGNFGPINVPLVAGSNPNGLWLVQVTGVVNGKSVVLLSPFVPDSKASISGLDVDVATTLLAERMLSLAPANGAAASAQFLQAVANIPALLLTIESRIVGGTGGGAQVGLSDVTAANLNALVAQIADEALLVVPATFHTQTFVHGQGAG